MLGRRVAVLVQPARLSALTPLRQCPYDSSTRAFLLYHSRRSYATPSRPRKAVGEPSRPVKRAVKRSAAVADSPESAAKQLVEKKKAAAKPRTRAKKTETAGAADGTEAVKPKKVRPKKVKVVVELTPEQEATKAAKDATKAAVTEARNVKQTAIRERKEARAVNAKVKAKSLKTAQASKEKIAKLKEVALSPPKIRPLSAYVAFIKDKAVALKGANGDPSPSEHLKRVAAEWKELSAADIEHYNHLSRTLHTDSIAAYKSWLTSHTPAQILAANRARFSLRRLQPAAAGKQSLWRSIDDERAPKLPGSPWTLFTADRYASGDMKHIKLGEAAKLISQEWKVLDEGEKEKYRSLNNQDLKRYSAEYERVYGLPLSYGRAKDATTVATPATDDSATPVASEDDTPVAATASA